MKRLYLISILLFITSNASFAFPAKHIYTEIIIDAPVEAVWVVLADNNAYPQWNPYHVKVDGELKLGNALDVEIHKPNGDTVEIEPHVMRIIPYRELTWGGGIKGIFYGEHVFLLEAIENNKTRLIQKEDFSGLVIPFASLEAIEEGYTEMNEALKIRVEAKIKQQGGQ